MTNIHVFQKKVRECFSSTFNLIVCPENVNEKQGDGVPRSKASTQTYKSAPPWLYPTVSINSPYHVKQTRLFPATLMLAYAVQEQSLKHASSQALEFQPFSTLAPEVSGTFTFPTFKNPHPPPQASAPCILKHPSHPSLILPVPGRPGFESGKTRALELVHMTSITLAVGTALSVGISRALGCWRGSFH